MKALTALLTTVTTLATVTAAAPAAHAEPRKSPLLAAGLNFFVPGAGYAYNGEKPLYETLPMIAGAIGLTYLEQVHEFDDGKRLMDHDQTAFGVLFGAVFVLNTALAIDAYREARSINARTAPSEQRAWRLDLRRHPTDAGTAGYSLVVGRSF